MSWGRSTAPALLPQGCGAWKGSPGFPFGDLLELWQSLPWDQPALPSFPSSQLICLITA